MNAQKLELAAEQVAVKLSDPQRKALQAAIQQPLSVRLEKQVAPSTLSSLRRLGVVNEETRALTPLGQVVRTLVETSA